MIYFDASATSYKKPKCVKKSVNNALKTLTGNPGRGGHIASSRIAEIIFETRESVKNFFNAQNYEVIFTKNCTEALNLSIFGCLNDGDNVITTIYEHNSVLRPLEEMKHKGVTVTIINCKINDFHNKLEKFVLPNTKLVITSATSNVTGESCNLKEIGKICKRHNIIYLVDGAQSSGHKKIDLSNCNVDMYAFAGHKGLLSTTGVGGLIIKNNIKLKPIIFGGTGTSSLSLKQPEELPESFESGTLPSIAIVSLLSGIKFLERNINRVEKTEKFLSNYLYKKLKNLTFIELYSSDISINVFSFNLLKKDSSEVANILNEKYQICVRSGLHCAPLIHRYFGTEKSGAVRASIDFTNTKKEVDYFIKALTEIANN